MLNSNRVSVRRVAGRVRCGAVGGTFIIIGLTPKPINLQDVAEGILHRRSRKQLPPATLLQRSRWPDASGMCRCQFGK